MSFSTTIISRCLFRTGKALLLYFYDGATTTDAMEHLVGTTNACASSIKI